MIKLELTVEEALEYQKFEARLEGFLAGVQSALEYQKRQKLNDMLKARGAGAGPEQAAAAI